MKALLIDPTACAVREVEHAGTLASVCSLIEAGTIDAFRIDRNAAIYIDDEGLLAQPPHACFQVRLDGEWSQPLVGRGLVVGTTRSGGDAAAPFTCEEIAARLRFVTILPPLPLEP